MQSQPFSWPNILIRFFFALILVLGCYNPHGYSYFDWALKDFSQFTVLKGFVGVVIIIGWTVFLRATLNSLGPFGITLAFAFFGTLIWLIVDSGLVSADNITVLTYLVEIVIAGVLATGMSWSHIRRRLSGQFDVDETEAD